MPEAEALSYVETELAQRIDNFDSSRVFYRSVNNAIMLSTAMLSALATVLIGVNQRWNSPWLSIPALLCSAAVGVAAAYDGFLRSKDMWILHDDTRIAMKRLQSQIAYAKVKALGPLNQDEIDRFFLKYEELLLREHEAWRTLRTTRDQLSDVQSHADVGSEGLNTRQAPGSRNAHKS